MVIDEVQRYWRPRSLGTRPPDHVTRLETHRHQGVDFVLITQRPNQIDANVRGHVGRHMHLRRLFGGARSIIYEWDACQINTERVSQAIKTYWSYPKSAYKLYTSSVLHIKQKHKYPAWLLIPVLAVAAGVVLLPRAFEVFTNASSGKGVFSTAKPLTSPAPVATASTPQQAASDAQTKNQGGWRSMNQKTRPKAR